MNKKVVCATCGSEDLIFDGRVKWNVEKQEWEVYYVDHDENPYCNECEDECEYKEVTLDDDCPCGCNANGEMNHTCLLGTEVKTE